MRRQQRVFDFPHISLALITLLGIVSGSGRLHAAAQEGVYLTWQPQSDYHTGIDPWVLEQAMAGQVEFLVFLDTQADLRKAAMLKTKNEKGAFVYQALTQTAAQTQAPLIQYLKGLGVAYRPYWIANMIWVRGGATILQNLATHPSVAYIYANPAVQMPEATIETGQPPAAQADSTAVETIEWNLLKIKADLVWDAGTRGQGVVIAGQDTGYDWDHPAILRQYRGWDSASSEHNYNWHDAIHANNPNSNHHGNACGFDSQEPCDDHGHGTHTMGILVGEDEMGNLIGVAPAARWIGCRNMEEGWGTPASYAECYQWFLAPTDLEGNNPDPSRAPDIINNSWSCPPSEGCTNPTVLQAVVEAVRAAGILSVHSAGNDGPTCSSIDTPAAIYDASFTVGNTTAADTLAPQSSRGPVTIDASGRIKPDIAAPGTDIRSAWPGGGYRRLSGTSMAGPHAAGLAALLISAQPGLSGQVDILEALIEQSAAPVSMSLTEVCGGIASTTIPNNYFGWGRVDAWEAYLGLFPFRYYYPIFFNP